jgi:hypothetical protein
MAVTKMSKMLMVGAVTAGVFGASSATEAAMIMSYDLNPPTGAQVQQAGNTTADNGSSTVWVGQSFKWDTNLALKSITVQDNNGQAKVRDGTLYLFSFTSEANALSFTSPNSLISDTYSRSTPLGNDVYLTHTFDTPVALTSGSYYAFAFSANANHAYKVQNSNPYAFGSGAKYDTATSTWTLMGSSRDMTFYLTAIPEPASLSLLAIGGLALLRRTRRVG